MKDTNKIYLEIKNSTKESFFLMSGPCVVENENMPFEIAEHLKEICDELGVYYIFKASYRKANRSSLSSFTGIGDKKAMELIKAVGEKFDIPVVTDVHSAEEVLLAAQYADILQIPAFLCRQTDLLLAAGESKKIVNIKKGQFLSPEAMKFAVDKVRSTGNEKVMLTERGTQFGYQDLIVDYRGVVSMKENNCPVVLDATHSLQVPNQSAGVTGGRPDLIETIAKAGIAVGFDGLFLETHPEPSKALSDGANMLPLSEMKSLLTKLVHLNKALK